MKSVKTLMILSMLATSFTSAGASAQTSLDSKINEAAKSAQASAEEKIESKSEALAKLQKENDELLMKIGAAQDGLKNAKASRKFRLIMTAGLAATSGLLLYAGATDKGEMIGMAMKLYGAIGAGGAAVISGATAGYSHYLVVVDSSKLEDLKKQLESTRAKLERKQNALKN